MIKRSWIFLMALPMLTTAPTAQANEVQTTWTYKKVGDLEIRADVYGAEPGAAKPVVLWIHGGALIAGHRSMIPPMQRDLYLANGFGVVSIDYRLAPETKLPLIIEDLQDAVAWIRREGPQQFGFDKDRLAVIGHSAGGYLTLMAGFAVEPPPKALVSLYGYGDITSDWYSKPDPFYSERRDIVSREQAESSVGSAEISGSTLNHRFKFYLYCRQTGRWPNEVAGADPKADPDFFKPYSPILNIDANYPPTLLLHGDADTDVPYQQSVLFEAELKRQGVPVRLNTIPGGPHVFDHVEGGLKNPKTQAVFDEVVAFLKDKV